jgi:proline iminopeptidase
MRARVRDTELYFDVDGMGLVPEGGRMVERIPLFLLHGGPGGDHSSFKTSSGGLRDVAQLVFVDHRGSGRSAKGDVATYTMDNNIDDLDALRVHLGFDRIAVLGSSYGGMVAQGYALRYPQHVSNLILVCTAPSYRFLEDARRIVHERGTPEQVRVCERLWEGTFHTLEQL